MEDILVADIMTQDPVTVSPNTNLLECAKIMVKKRVGSLIIINQKKLVGFLAQSDILWALIKRPQSALSKIKSIDISPRKLATIKPTTTVKEAFQKMKKLKFERLPVIQKGELVGVITIRDILNFHPELYPEIDEFTKIREETEKLKRIKKAREFSGKEGICEECGAKELLYRFNGRLICANCKDFL
jgi:CBS domain-containing protein